MSKGFSLANPANATFPDVAFDVMKDEILGKDYLLNLVFVSPAEMRRLNLQYRNIDKATDILSFPLSQGEGEMYLCEEECRVEAKKFERDYDNFIPFLFIHGCVHLKGYDHGGTMEELEKKFRGRFGV